MRKQKVLGILIMLVISGFSLSFTSIAHTEEEPFIVPLIAGQTIDVGTVSVWNDGVNIYVEYELASDEWVISDTHLYIGKTDPSMLNSNPGQFPYIKTHDPGVDSDLYIISLGSIDGYHLKLNKKGKPTGSWEADENPGVGPGVQVFIAAHAVVCHVEEYDGGLDMLTQNLPAQVTLTTVQPGLGFGKPSYFDSAISGGTDLDGMYDGYCIDIDHYMDHSSHIVDVYSSYETLPAGVLEHPENLPLVNWIINQDWVGKASACGGTYTYGDVQLAIWMLVEDNYDFYPGPYMQCRVDEILADALANGIGFVPDCGEYLVIILVPAFVESQPSIIWIPIPCVPVYECETAWGDGLDGMLFPDATWATYFTYSIQ